jgi:hypothetical protein
MSPLNVAVTAALVFFASPVAAKSVSACGAGLKPAVTAELFFGRDIEHQATVSEDDWQRFLNAEVTPRFPDGLTVYDVYGQYRGSDGVPVREPTKAVLLVLSGERGERAKVKAIREAYKGRFRQQSVLLIQRSACVGF